MCDDVKGESGTVLCVCVCVLCVHVSVSVSNLDYCSSLKKGYGRRVLASLYLAAFDFHVTVLDTFLQEVTQMFSTLCYQHKHVPHLAGSEGRT